MSAGKTLVFATFMLVAGFMTMTGCGGGKSGGTVQPPPPVERPFGSHFGVHLGNLDYAGASSHLTALGSHIYVRNEIFRDAFGWRNVKSLAVQADCFACCDPTRSSCNCDVGDFYYCTPGSRDDLLDTPILSDFHAQGFNQLITSYPGRYDDTPPTSQDDLIAAYPAGHEDIYREYVRFVTRNFEETAKYWEIGNESDLALFWAGTPTEYASLISIASTEIRSECDTCRIGASFSGPGVASAWLTALNGVASSLDYVDIHHTGASFIAPGALDRWRAALPGKEFISTETGVPDATGFGGAAGGSADAQARDLVKLNTLMFAEGYNRIYWYLIDTDYGAGAIFLHNALIDEDGTRKSAFTAYQKMIDKVDFFTALTELGNGMYKYEFSGHGPVYVLWCDSGTCSPPLEITGQVRVTDYLGNATTRSATGLRVTSSPIYVEGL